MLWWVSRIQKYGNFNLDALAHDQLEQVVYFLNATRWEKNSSIEKPTKTVVVRNLIHVEYCFSCVRVIQTYRSQFKIKMLISQLGVDFNNFHWADQVLLEILASNLISEWLNSYLVYWSITVTYVLNKFKRKMYLFLNVFSPDRIHLFNVFL